MSLLRITCLAAALAAACPASAQDTAPAQSARLSPLAPKRLINGLAPVTLNTVAAVGQRGHILLSADAGLTWRQVATPVRADLTAVQFVDARHGFAVGHNGLGLASTDGGEHWQVVLDGQRANALARQQIEHDGAAPPRLLEELRRNEASGADKPLLDLYFSSPQHGFVVGAYNLIFETRDGGHSWTSWYARSANSDSLLNLYAIRRHREQWFVVGEAGLLLRLDRASQRFERVDTGYNGSLFGLLDTGTALIAYGMRGHAVISRDGGRQWQPLATGLHASITAAAIGLDGRWWLGDQLGNVVVSRDQGASFSALKLPFSMPLAALLPSATTLTLAGPHGVHSIPLPKD